MAKVAVLIPCYNEELTIASVVSGFRRLLPEASIYVYDNNSTDQTVEIAEANGVTVVCEPKQGKGNVVRTMFREVEADCYLLVDGDDTYPVEYAQALCNEVLNGRADMVIGDRLSTTYSTENKRLFHNSGNRLVRNLINFLFRSNVKDIMTGYRAFSPLFVKTFPVLSKGFEIETEMTIHALDKNLNLVELPVPYRDRPENSVSKLNTFSDGRKVLLTIFDLFKDYRPLLFFSVISTFLAILSTVLFVPVFIEYVQTGVVLRFPTLFISGFIMLSALLSFFCGLILDSVANIARKEFEFKMKLMQTILNKET